MSDLDPAFYQRRLLHAFRTLRNNANLTQEQVAVRLGWSVSKVLRVENGKNNITRADLAALLEVYGVTSRDAVRDLLDLARQASRPSMPEFRDIVSAEFRVYTGLESSASVIREYEPALIPGLLQTMEYADAVITALSADGIDRDVIARRLDIRRQRQRLLTPDGPSMHFLFDEAAVRRQVGGRAVMQAQLRRLKELAALPNVTMQIVPFSAGEHAGMSGPFILLEFPDDEPLLYLEDARQDLLAREDAELTRSYQRRFAQIAELATPASRFDRIVDDFLLGSDLVGARM